MLYLLPGMGADHSMYAGPWRTLAETRFVDWPAYRGEYTLGELAERMIDAVGITPADEVGGTSLGGMVALEIARRLGQRRVLLLSSATSPRDVNAGLRMLSPLAPLAPLGLAKVAVSWLRRPTARMLLRADTRFLRAMCRAIIAWEGFADPNCRLIRIHGDRDWMLRCPPDAARVRGAGHLAVLTHADQCVALVRERWFDAKPASHVGTTGR